MVTDMAANRSRLDAIRIVQIGMNTSDLAGSLRFYREVFGFSNAGGNVLWGDIMRIQGLDPEARSLIWWMVGGATFFQLEFFHHSKPMQRPLPVDWRASDHGWVRFGLAVSSLDRVESGLNRWQVVPVVTPAVGGGTRRLAFRDPFVGVIVEVCESRASTCPTLTYVASSVASLARARQFYGEVIGLELEPLDRLHAPADEALWGLANADRDGFTARLGEMTIEVLEYRNPRGRARPDRLISDQGIMNIALGSRNLAQIRALIERIRSDGHQPTFVFEGTETLGTYFVDPGCELEILSVPEQNDAATGFAPAGPFLADYTSGPDEG
jgi:catechol 2,3-dioxygenase-like lactoylglutathione lyase family enzyme